MSELIKRDTDSNFTQTSTDEALLARDGKILNEKKVTGSVGSTAPTSGDFVENEAVYFQYNSTSNNAILQEWLNAVYPIGSIYLSVNSTNPGTLFGGTWTQLQNRFLLGAGSSYTAGATGGAASVTSGGTALTTDQIPAHTHGSKSLTGYTHMRRQGNTTAGANIIGVTGSSGIVSTSQVTWSGSHANINGTVNVTDPTIDRVTVDATHEHTSVGGGAAHKHTVSTMPPYLVVYMWQRTA